MELRRFGGDREEGHAGASESCHRASPPDKLLQKEHFKKHDVPAGAIRRCRVQMS